MTAEMQNFAYSRRTTVALPEQHFTQKCPQAQQREIFSSAGFINPPHCEERVWSLLRSEEAGNRPLSLCITLPRSNFTASCVMHFLTGPEYENSQASKSRFEFWRSTIIIRTKRGYSPPNAPARQDFNLCSAVLRIFPVRTWLQCAVAVHSTTMGFDGNN